MAIDKKIETYLKTIGTKEDHEIDLGEVALHLSAAGRNPQSIERYQNKFKKMVDEVKEAFQELLDEGAEDSLGTRLAALKDVIVYRNGFEPVSDSLGNVFNADVIQAIDTGKVTQVVLCLFYVHLSRAQSWEAHILHPPGGFLVRLDYKGERQMFDPADDCRVLQAHDLRNMVKDKMGENAELSSEYFEPVDLRDILVGLQNSVKLRQIEAEDYSSALDTVTLIRLIAPEEKRILLDAGILYARTQQPEAAIEALEEYLPFAPTPRDRHEAALLLQDIRRLL